MTNAKSLKVLNLEPEGYSREARSIIESIADIDDGPLSREMLIRNIEKYDVLIVRLGHKIDKEIIDAATNLKTIVSATTGLNHIDLEETERKSIKVLSLKGETVFLSNIHATAEHTWALLLSLVRKMPQAHMHALSGGWNRDCFKGNELNGRTLGIVGMGRIGSKVARYGLAFGMDVIVCDEQDQINLPEGARKKGLKELLQISDIVTIHINYNYENHGIFGEAELTNMKEGSLFINTSRGEVVDENALLKGLRNGHLGGAALDVLCSENDPKEASDGLIAYAKENDNLIITPHIGGCTYESMEKTEIFMAQKLLGYYKNNGKGCKS